MFARGISILISSSLDVGNIPSPRPSDSLAEKCAQDALRVLQTSDPLMPFSQRLRDPDAYVSIQRQRRARLESFLWIEPNAAAVERIMDLLVLICEESTWSASAPFDDPAHPAIDLQAAETGVLLAWLMRRHGARLNEADPRIHSLLLGEVRRRLISPILAHDDYPFMAGNGRFPALILSDLLLICVLMEKNPHRRQQPVKLLLRMLDSLCLRQSDPRAPLEERLADACAIADLARLMKRLTRGEFDLTRTMPPEGWLDDVIIPWIHGDFFVDPAGQDSRPEISGMDLFRLGYLSQDRALCALGAQLHRQKERSGFSVSGRILNMEYMRAAQDECNAPMRLKRASAENGSLMLSRVDALFAALSGTGRRANVGDITLFADGSPILIDVGGVIHSLPLIDDCAPLTRLHKLPPTDADFGADRDLMSVDLTTAYPEKCMMSAYQRTLMTMRGDGTVRLVDAFEFIRPPQTLRFRFVTVQRPIILRELVRLGPVDLSWDAAMLPEVEELPESEAFPGGCFLLSFTLHEVPRRLICGFTFEKN